MTEVPVPRRSDPSPVLNITNPDTNTLMLYVTQRQYRLLLSTVRNAGNHLARNGGDAQACAALDDLFDDLDAQQPEEF